MAFTIRQNEKIAVSRETTQGVYVPPAEADFVLPLADGIELNPAKELVDREILTPNIGRILPRTGIRSVSGTIGLEAKAKGVEGEVPEQGLLTEAALGAVQIGAAEGSIAAGTFALANKTFTITGQTYFVNDIIMIKFSGAYFITPIVAVSGTTITTLRGLDAAVTTTGATSVSKHATYKAANAGHPSFSVTKEVESDLVEEGLGCRVSTMAIENFTTGQLATHNYSVDGLTYVWATGGADFTDADNFTFIAGNAADTTTTVAVSVDGGTATTFTFMGTTPGANQFNTPATLATLLDGIAGLSAAVDGTATTQINLSSSQKENGTIAIVFTDVGDDAFNKTSVTLTAVPAFDSSLPPVILEACAYQDDKRLIINELAVNVENTIGYITSTCDINGRISSRVTARATTGTFNPYKTASVDGDQTAAETLEQFNFFNNNTEYSIFAYAGNPTGTSGEYTDVVAYWLPSCLSTEIPEAEQDGVLQYNISFVGSSGPTGGDADICVAYI